MVKLKHPGVVQMLENYEESKHGVALVTEPLFASAATVILKNYNNIPRVPLELKEAEISPLVRCYCCCCCFALSFVTLKCQLCRCE